jgi:hypothetical protein
MLRRYALILLAVVVIPASAYAEELNIEEVPSVTALAPEQIKPDVIAFSDRRPDEPADAATGLVRFEDWGRARPTQQRLLSLYTGYEEPSVTVTAGSGKKTRRQRLYVYVAQARFLLMRPAESLDLSRHVSVAFLTRIDPAISHRKMPPADAMPLKDRGSANNRNPMRPWCESLTLVICVQSHYRLEGKLPLGIKLANKVRARARKISEAIDFQSELRLLALEQREDPALRELSGLDTPIAGALEQSIFYVNQVMEFGKFLALFQADSNDPQRTVVTAFVAIAVKASLFEMKKQFEKVPVLKNLIPAQVLVGNSSFNTGSSISAGLPKYTRSHIKAIAKVLRSER